MPTKTRRRQGRIASTYITVGKKFTARVVLGHREASSTNDDAVEAVRRAREKASRA